MSIYCDPLDLKLERHMWKTLDFLFLSGQISTKRGSNYEQSCETLNLGTKPGSCGVKFMRVSNIFQRTVCLLAAAVRVAMQCCDFGLATDNLACQSQIEALLHLRFFYT